MPLDGIMLAAVARRLDQELRNARILRICQPLPDELLLHCRRPGRTVKLLISAHPRFARIHTTEGEPANPAHPPAFCTLLRKHLEPARILRVEQPGLERIVTIHAEASGPEGQRVGRALVVELMGSRSNVVLVDEAGGAILDGLRRVSREHNPHREILPGAVYVPPPRQAKADPRIEGEDDFARRLRLAAPEHPVFRILLEAYEGLGPASAREIVARAGLDPGILRRDLPLEEIASLWEAFAELAAGVGEGRLAPVLVLDEEGRPVDAWAFPLVTVPPERQTAVPDVLGALDRLYTAVVGREATEELRRDLLRLVGRDQERAARKQAVQEEELRTAQEADRLRLCGELLTAHLHRIPKGAHKTTVPNYYAGGEPLEIPLDPSLAPAENAQRYFKRYARAKKGEIAIQRQLEATRRDLAYLEQVAISLEQAESLAELREIADELAAVGLGTPAAPGTRVGVAGRRRAAQAPAAPFLVRSADGLDILVGRNNRQNDHLTMGIASPGDLWLHAKDLAGAHVVVRTGGHSVPDRTLEQAALLAAHFSRGRHSSKVPVDYTLRRHVRKPPGARPGMVIYDHHRTVLVTPTPEAVARVLAGRCAPSGGEA